MRMEIESWTSWSWCARWRSRWTVRAIPWSLIRTRSRAPPYSQRTEGISRRRVPDGTPGGTPSEFLRTAVCRADDCDQDGHARPADAGYDFGAYEGTGTSGPAPSCTFDPGQCAAPSGSSVIPSRLALDLEDSAGCSQEPVWVHLNLARVSGGGEIAGIEFELVADPAYLLVVDPQSTVECVRGADAPEEIDVLNRPAGSGSPTRLFVMALGLDGTQLPEGEIARCRFNVNPQAELGTGTLVEIQKTVATMSDGTLFVVDQEPGWVYAVACNCF